MRPAIVLGLLATAFVLRVALGEAPGASFDDRFESAEVRMEALSRSIEEELDKTRSR
ncbi:MAG: hypothetical protein AAF559_10730 [Pseudomonadota bacterium]